MRGTTILLAGLILLGTLPAGRLNAAGDAASGAKVYRICTACHSLVPDLNLTGPSLAGLWGRKAGSLASFHRYSDALRAQDFEWNETTLGGWVLDPAAMVPGTTMQYRGVETEKLRDDLVAFLEIALRPGGVERAVEMRLITESEITGQVPSRLGDAEADRRVTAIRHCGDAFHVRTADGKDTAYWEYNVNFKVDTSERGPGERPVIAGTGMMGDRVSIIFPDVEALIGFPVPEC